jgi:hypothetical protein
MHAPAAQSAAVARCHVKPSAKSRGAISQADSALLRAKPRRLSISAIARQIWRVARAARC